MSVASRRAFLVLGVLVAALITWFALRPAPADPRLSATADGPPGPSAKRAIGAERESIQAMSSARPWRGATAKITGRVHDEVGKPIAGASVCLMIEDQDMPAELRYAPKCTTSAADGRYTLVDVHPVEMTLSASAPTFIPGQHDPPGRKRSLEPHPGEVLANIDVELRSGGVEIRGIVKDVAGGVVEGAQVTGGGNWADGFSLVLTDADGAFSMWTAPGEVGLLAQAEGYASGSSNGTAPGYTFELLLTPESVVGGRVIDAATRKPVADARVDVNAPEDGGVVGVTYSDEAGRFRVGRLEPARYAVTATTIDRHGMSNESRRVGLGEAVEDFEIEVHPAASISGHVVLAGETPTPCEDSTLTVVGRTTKHAGWQAGDRDGLAIVQGLPPDTYDVDVRCAGAVATEEYEPVVLTEAPVEGFVWEVERGLTLTGLVVDAAGKPIANASVNARQTASATRAKRSGAWGHKTGKDGRFTLDGLFPGTYDVEASHEDPVSPEQPTSHVLTAGDKSEVMITLGAGGSVRGRVVDAKRRPVAGADVTVVGKTWQPGASTADDGTFLIDNVREGEHRVKATGSGWDAMRAPGTSDDDLQGAAVSVRVGEVTEVELVVEEQFGSIAGRVVDADGGPVDDAFVSFSRESDSAKQAGNRARRVVRWSGWGGEAPVLTDRSGAFTLERVPTGKHTLIAQRKGGGEGVVEHIETGSTGVVIELSEGAAISGVVALAGGGTPREFRLTASDDAQGIDRSETFFRTSGAWRLSDLPPGKYVVAVSATEGGADTTIELGSEPKNGVRLELVPRVDVTGTVVDLQTGEPVPNMMVSISPLKGPGGFGFSDAGDREHVTDDAGSFTIRGAPAGAVRVMIFSRSFFGGSGKTYGWTRLRANIPADQMSYALPPMRIALQRTEGSERGGDLGFGIADTPPESEPEDLPLKVAVIRPGGPAATTELKIGDVIVDVDGHDVTGENRYLYGSLSRVKEGASVTLGLEGGGRVTIVAGKPV